MVQLKLRLATMTEQSIAAITNELQHFDPAVRIIAQDPEACEITFELYVPRDEDYQALGDKCEAWTNEADPSVLVYTVVRG